MNKGIYFLIEDFYPVVHGATSQIMLLGQRFAAKGAFVRVITRKIKAEHKDIESIKGFEIIRVKPMVGLHRLGKYLMLLPVLLRLIQERKTINVIVVCDMKVLGVVGVLAGKLLRKKCVLRAESCGELNGSFAVQYEQSPSEWKIVFSKFLLKIRNRLLLNADCFLSISSTITQEFKQCGVKNSSIYEITNGIDLKRFNTKAIGYRAEMRTILKLNKKRCFAYTGRLTKGKGLMFLMQVWRQAVKELDEIHLLIVGSGQKYALSCEEKIKKFVIEEGLEATVTFTGNTRNVEKYLHAADYFIFLSQSEGLGLSLIEALACGKPCIATKVGGIIDIIEDGNNGLLVEYGDQESVVKAMKELVYDRIEAEEFSRRGWDTVVKKFNIDNIVDDYMNMFSIIAKWQKR